MDMLRRWARALALAVFLVVPATSGAALQTLDGSPLNVHLADGSNMQARFDSASFGSTLGFWYSPSSDTANAGFGIRFADGPRANTTFSHRDVPFTPVSNGPVTGNGTAASPFTTVTVYTVPNTTGGPIARITQTARYVNGQSRYRMTYEVENLYTAALRFRTMTGGDLYVDGNDSGVGVFIGSTPRFVGGTNVQSQITGGAEEVLSSRLAGDALPVPVPPWAGYEVNHYSTVLGRWSETNGLANSIISNVADNGVAVEWEDHLPVGQGLAPGAKARYEVLWKVRQAQPLTLSPPTATPEVGTTHTITAALRNSADQPVNGTLIRWEITGANPSAGSATTFGNGHALIQYAGPNAGLDTVTAYADENNDGVRQSEEPTQTVRATWRPETEVDPASFESINVPGGGTVNVNTQIGTDDPVQRWLQIPNSQAGQFEECPNGAGRRMQLPINVPIAGGAGETVVPGSVELLVVDAISGNTTSPLSTMAFGGSVPSNDVYRFVIECILRSDLYVRYTLQDGSGSQTFIVPIGGLVLIDPQGVVYDASAYNAYIAQGQTPDEARAGAAIPGATVRLQRLVDGEFRNVLAGDPGIAPHVNPQITGADGRYQWDVAEGAYRVVVSAPGYETVNSRSVDIPPPVLDLHIPMVRPGQSVAQVKAKAAEAAALSSTQGGPATVIRTRHVTFRLLEQPKVDGRRGTVLGTATCKLTTAACTNVLVRLMATSAQPLRARAAQRPRLRQLHLRSFRIKAGSTQALRLRVGPKAYSAAASGLKGVVAVRDTRANKDADEVARIRMRRR
jgi:hypothetical protein